MIMPDETLWPPLPYDAWKETCANLHLWSQIVGKVRLAQTPWVNHSWHVALYVTPRGLTTGPIPHGGRIFDIAFDFIAHELHIRTSDGGERRIKLQPQSVASFHKSVMEALKALNVPVTINDHPNEIPNATPFTQDHANRPYAYPEPDGFRDGVIRPSAALFHKDLREFILPYESVRTASHPERMLLDFLYSTYEAAAVAGKWDRANLECREGLACVPRAIA